MIMDHKDEQPTLIVVMGVSGCGKTTLGQKLATSLGIDFVEADDFHSQAAKARMARGMPLTDQWRRPWIRRICSHLQVVCFYLMAVLSLLFFQGSLKNEYTKINFWIKHF